MKIAGNHIYKTKNTKWLSITNVFLLGSSGFEVNTLRILVKPKYTKKTPDRSWQLNNFFPVLQYICTSLSLDAALPSAACGRISLSYNNKISFDGYLYKSSSFALPELVIGWERWRGTLKKITRGLQLSFGGLKSLTALWGAKWRCQSPPWVGSWPWKRCGWREHSRRTWLCPPCAPKCSSWEGGMTKY